MYNKWALVQICQGANLLSIAIQIILPTFQTDRQFA